MFHKTTPPPTGSELANKCGFSTCSINSQLTNSQSPPQWGHQKMRDGMSTQSGCLKARAHSLKGVAHFKSDLKKRGTTLSYGRQGNRLSQWSLTRAMESSQAHVAYHNTKGHKIMRVPNSRKLELQPLTLAQG